MDVFTGDVTDQRAWTDDAANEQWIVWRELDLASEAEWALAELLAFAAMPLAGDPVQERPMLPEPRSNGRAATGAMSHAVVRAATSLDRVLGLCVEELEAIRRRLAGLTHQGCA
jgi:hypothetical protein